MTLSQTKILIPCELLYPYGSGGGLATHLWAKLLAQSGLHVRVVTNRFTNDSAYWRSGNLEIIRLPILGAMQSSKSVVARPDILLSSFFRKLVCWADVIYVPGNWYTTVPLAKALKKVVITHLHGYAAICSVGSYYDLTRNEPCRSRGCRPNCIVAHEKSNRRSASQVAGSALLNLLVWPPLTKQILLSDAFICVSHAQKRIITARLPSIASRSQVIYNPLPDIEASPIQGSDMAYFGGPTLLKGYGTLRAALLSMNHSTTVHATGFPDRSEAKIGQSRVVFYPRVSAMEVEEIYKKACAVIVPSLYSESFGYVVAEAILHGRIVIASNRGAIPELVTECPGVFLFDPSDPERLAEIIKRVGLMDVESQTDITTRGRRVFSRRFDNERSLEAFTDLLSRLTHREQRL
jgi:glycosyltransferase involved in cell wall biosynthesis